MIRYNLLVANTKTVAEIRKRFEKASFQVEEIYDHDYRNEEEVYTSEDPDTPILALLGWQECQGVYVNIDCAASLETMRVYLHGTQSVLSVVEVDGQQVELWEPMHSYELKEVVKFLKERCPELWS